MRVRDAAFAAVSMDVGAAWPPTFSDAELVQNEYDAGRTELAIEFGADALVVRENHRQRRGKRPSVMLGRGLVISAADHIEPKVSGVAAWQEAVTP
jgi:hypothetical protein